MRFLVLQLCGQFVEQIRKLNNLSRPRTLLDPRPGKFADNWLVPLVCALALILASVLDYVTDARMIFMPLYILPCMMLTLVLNLRWGVIAALLAAGASSWTEYATNKLSHYTLTEVFVWNFPMRFAVTVLVLLLLNRIRKENILFLHRKSNGC